MAESYSLKAVLGCVDKGFSSGLKAASKTTDSLVSKFKSGFSFGAWAAAGASAFRTVTGGITGLAKGIVQSGMEFESTMSTVKAISGATEDEMDRLTNLAKEMGATTKFTATESAEALKYMGMAGWDAGQMISGLPGILNLAAAGEADLGTTSDIVTDGLTAFGLGAEDAAHFADALAAAATSTNTDVLMMGETFKYVGPVCGTLGASMEDTSIAAGLMANAGVKASQAGTSLRRGLQNLINPTKPIAAAMEKYGVALATTSDGQVDLMGTMKNLRSALGGLSKTEQGAALSAIFGSNAMSGWAAIVSASDEDFQRVTESIYGCEGAAQKMADVKMDNLAGDVTLFQSAWDGVRQTLYDMEKGPLRSVVQTATKAMNAINDALKGNGISKFFYNLQKYTSLIPIVFDGVGSAFGDAFSAIKDSLGELNGEFGSHESIMNFRDVLESVAEKLKEFAGFIKEHADEVAKLIDLLPKLLAGFLAFKMVKTVISPVVRFGGAVVKIAGGVVGAVGALKNMFAVKESVEEVSDAAQLAEKNAKKATKRRRSTPKRMIASAKAFMMAGAGILMVSAGFALLADSATKLSKAGGPAIAVMAGLSAAVAGMTIGMTSLAKSLTAASPNKLKQLSKVMLSIGGSILMVCAGFALLAESAIRLSKAGGPAIAIMAGLVAAVAGITIGMTALAKSLTAASPKKLQQISKVMLSIGGAISAVVLSLAALALAVVPLASLGTTAVAPLAAFGVVVAGLAVVFSMVGEKLKASVVGIVAFAAAVSVMALAMAPLATTGTEGAIAMAAFGVVVAGLVAVFSIFGAALNVAIPGMVGLAIAAVGVGTGMRLATPFIEALPPLIKQIGDTASQVASALADAISKIVDAFSGLVSTIANAVSQIAESVGGTLCQIFQTAGDAISEVVGTIGDGISGIIDSISGGFATVLDSIAGIFDSIGGAALNAGKGFNEMATGIEKIVGLNLLDMSASLGAVAAGIGAITAVSGGMADAGTGMMNIGTGLMFISGFAAQAAEKLALIPQAVIPVSAAVPALVAAFSQLTLSVGGFVASSAGLSTFAAQMFVLVGVLGVASGSAASFGASMTGAGAGLAFVAGSARAAGASVKTIAGSAALAQGAVSGLRAALGTLKGGLSGIGAAAQGAAVKMIAAFSSSAAKAKAEGHQIGSSLQTGVSSGLSKTVSVTRQAFTNIINVFRSGASLAKASGIQIGNNVLTGIRTGMIKIPVIARTAMTAFSSAISGGSSRAVSTARRAASSIVTAFRSAHSGAYSAGRYIGQGLVSGLSSTLGQVRSMAASIAAAADKAIRAKAKIASPSKVTTKDGKYIGLGLVVGLKKMFGAVYSAGVGLAAMASKGIMDEAEIHSPSRKATKHGVNVGQGFANGLLASFKTVQSAAKGLAKTAFASLKSITAGKKGGFSSTASKVASSYEKSLTAQMNAQLSSMKKKLNSAIKKNKSVKKALNAAYDQYSKYLKDAVDKAISKTKDRLEKLGDAYQEKYEGFRDRLREYGDMFTSDSYGYVSMRNFDDLTKQIETLGANLEKLKGWGLSQSFMEELASMDTASALTATNELLKKGATEAKKYGKSYDKAMSTAASVSDKFYQSYFNTAVNKELSSLQSDLTKIGKSAMDGFVKGMNSKAKSLKGASKKLALSIVSTFKKYLKIHSPSKVFAMLGRYIGVGLINGLERIAGKVQSATENLVTLPDIRVPTPALATPGGSLAYSGVSEGLTQVPESEYVIIVPVELDGKEVARVTAPYTQRELNKLESRASRKRGVL